MGRRLRNGGIALVGLAMVACQSNPGRDTPNPGTVVDKPGRPVASFFQRVPVEIGAPTMTLPQFGKHLGGLTKTRELTPAERSARPKKYELDPTQQKALEADHKGLPGEPSQSVFAAGVHPTNVGGSPALRGKVARALAELAKKSPRFQRLIEELTHLRIIAEGAIPRALPDSVNNQHAGRKTYGGIPVEYAVNASIPRGDRGMKPEEEIASAATVGAYEQLTFHKLGWRAWKALTKEERQIVRSEGVHEKADAVFTGGYNDARARELRIQAYTNAGPEGYWPVKVTSPELSAAAKRLAQLVESGAREAGITAKQAKQYEAGHASLRVVNTINKLLFPNSFADS